MSAARTLTRYWAKPIPTRDFDWEAIRADYEPPMPVGYGATEAQAIQDLLKEEEIYYGR